MSQFVMWWKTAALIVLFLVVSISTSIAQVTDVLTKSVQNIRVIRSEPYGSAISAKVESAQFEDTSASKMWIVTSERDTKGFSTGIWLTRMDTKSKSKLIEPSTLDVRWSPKRDEFLCNIITLPKGSPGWNVGTLWLADITGSKRQLYKWGGGLHWSPDGEKIMLASVASSGFGVVVLDRLGKVLFADEEPFTADDPGGVWAPDSKHIAYGKGKVKGSDMELIRSEVVIANIETGERKILVQNQDGTWDQPLRWDSTDRLLISHEMLKISGKSTPKQYLYWVLK